MSSVVNRLSPRPLGKQLRHRRRDWIWRARMHLGDYGEAKGGASPDPSYPDLAVGAVALGAKYRDWCLTMLRSLRGHGRFAGPVYIITDDIRAFAGEQNLCLIQVPPVRPRLVAKSCKIMLLEWVREPVFLYIDADVVMTAPLQPWYDAMRPRLADAPVLCYADRKPFEGAYHSGIILADRERARPVYRRWLRRVRSGRYQFDQECLAVTADEGGISHMPEGDFQFLTDMLDQGVRPPRFVHVTNGLIREHPEAQLRDFLRQTIGIERMPESFGRDA